MVRNRLLYLVALVSVTVFYAFFYGWFSEFLWYLVLVLPLFSLVLSLPSMLGLRVRVEVASLVRRGGSCAMAIRHRSRFPLCGVKLRMRLEHSITGQKHRFKFISRRDLQDTWELPVEHCGCVRWQLDRVWVCDYLGLIRLPRRLSATGLVLVLPWAVPPRNRPSLRQYLSRPPVPKAGGGFAEHHELRDYRPGDALRTIHWKLTAKTDRPVVREPQEPPSDDIVLSLDLWSDPEALDSVLDQTLYLSQWLMGQELSHQVVWLSGSSLYTCQVREPEDCARMIRELCAGSPAAPGLTAKGAVSGAQWYYHVEPRREEGTQP